MRWPLLSLLFLLSGVCVLLLLGTLASSVSPLGWCCNSKMDGGEFLCFLLLAFAVIGAPPVLRDGSLFGAVLFYSHPGERDG